MKKSLHAAAAFIHKISNVCVWASGVALFLMALLIFVDVIGRYVFNAPITGSQEIVELMIVVVLYLGLAYSTYKRAHIRVDVVISAFPSSVKLLFLGVTSLLCMLVSSPVAVQMFRQGLVTLARGSETNVLHIKHYPVYFLASFGNALLTLEFLADGVKYIREAVEARAWKKEKTTGSGKGETP